MPVTITMKVTGMTEALMQVGKIEAYLESDRGREDIAFAGLRGAAVLFDRNFATEGGEVGGWADLSDRTIEERMYLGFGAGPILIRHGDLRELTATSLMTASGAGTFTKTDSQGKSIQVQLKAERGAANVVATGEKSWNQVRTATAPARPYWFINSGVEAAIRKMAVEEIVERIERLL